MMTINLDDEAEKYLLEILAQEGITSQELVKKLLHSYFMNRQSNQTVLERMGGYPENLLEGELNLSDRDLRQQKISEYLQSRNQEKNFS